MAKNNRTRNKQHHYTAAQLEWLREWYPQMTRDRLAMLFNKTFQTAITKGALHGTLLRYKIKCGRTGRFEKGMTPYNKGMKDLRHSPATEFRKGNVPVNTKPVGTEVLHADSYLWVKIAEPNKWRQKHVLVWEQHNGPKPPGHVVIFKDQNKQYITIENLILVERKLLLQINRNGYAKTPDTIKPSIIALSSLEVKIQRLKSGKHHATPTQHT